MPNDLPCHLHVDGLRLQGVDCGEGRPVIFQHGLGGNEAQIAEVFPAGYRRLTLECRSHGGSDAGEKLSIAAFADDVLAFADQQGVRTFVVGGISMGAAIALRIAVTAPQRVTALILSRPAWMWQSAPANMRVFADVANCLQRDDRDGFEALAVARRMANEAPDNLATMRGFFDRPDKARLPPLFRAIAADGPGVSKAGVTAIRVPVLVIGTALDMVHPLSHARAFANTISHAQFAEITPKTIDRQRHADEARAAIDAFLRNF